MTVAIVGGLLAAVSFAISTLVSARASRLTGAPVTVAGAMLTGLLILLPVAVLTVPSSASDFALADLAGAAAAGGANVVGLLLAYSAYRLGAVGVVSTIASTEGAIAAAIAVLAGERLAPGMGPLLALIAAGVVVTAAGGGREREEGVVVGRERSLQAAAMAAVAATMFGTGLYLTGLVSGSLPLPWVLLPGRVVGVVVVGIPVLVLGRSRIVRRALPFVIVCGIVEITGFTAFAIGARVDIATTSVLASMFAPMAALAAFVLFGERLARLQVAGIALVVGGVALLGAAGGVG